MKQQVAHPLRIVVCIKPVPDPVGWEKLELEQETLLLNRSKVAAVINPLDLNAIEQALAIKGSIGDGVKGSTGGSVRGNAGRAGRAGSVEIAVLTMAPPEAEEQLREALAMGCDTAFLASDRAMAGADTLATARCLAAAIKKIGGFDLVFCGAYSLDGSTAQVGPQVAELLDLPDLTHVTNLQMKGKQLRAVSRVEDGEVVCECDLPALVTFDREANQPRLPAMSGIRRARGLPVVSWSLADLGLAREEAGLAGSPTRMLNIYTKTQGRKGEILAGSAAEMADQLVEKLVREKLIESA